MKTGKINICLTAIRSSVFSFLSLAIIGMLHIRPLLPAIISCEMTNSQSRDSSMVRQPCWLDETCLVLLRRIFLSEAMRTLISVRLDVHRGRACVCDFSLSSVADLCLDGDFWPHVIGH